MVKDVDKMTIKEKALLELREERAKEAKDKLKGLYRRQADAKKMLGNIEREIEDYLMQLDETEKDLEG